MTVAELIAALQALPADAPVYFHNEHCCEYTIAPQVIEAKRGGIPCVLVEESGNDQAVKPWEANGELEVNRS